MSSDHKSSRSLPHAGTLLIAGLALGISAARAQETALAAQEATRESKPQAQEAAHAKESARRRALSIASGTLETALDQLAAQSRVQLIYDSELVRGMKSPALAGRFSLDDALKQLLDGTGLTWSYVNGYTVVLKRADMDSTAKKNSDEPEPGSAVEEITVFAKTPEVLVVGSKIINADIRRTEDDPQPYVVFQREQIERSPATNLEEFLKTRLPMNTVQETMGQAVNPNNGSQSTINLRGLGANQTLILIDGRRLASAANILTQFNQPDINGVPLSLIERIEVLPSTASGIYGGGATGGVVNIITRKDYSGVDLSVTYGSDLRGDAASYRFDGSTGFSVEGGKTRILLSASHAGSDPLLVGDRDFAARSRSLQMANNPSVLSASGTPPRGYTSNIRSQNGSNLVLDPALGGTPLNSPRTSVPVGYAGPAADAGAALVANAGQYNLDLPTGDPTSDGRSLVATPTVNSAAMNVRREFGQRVEAFGDILWSENQADQDRSSVTNLVTLPADGPNNPFTTPIIVSFPGAAGMGEVPAFSVDNDMLRAGAGLIVRLGRGWSAGADYSWSRARLSRSYYFGTIVGDPDGPGPRASMDTALTDGTLDVLRDLNAFPLDLSPYLLLNPEFVSHSNNETTLSDVTLRLSGPLLRLPGGAITLSGLVESREEKVRANYSHTYDSETSTRSFRFVPSMSQETLSYYLEARAPLISAANSLPFTRDLELQASVRRDEVKTQTPSPTFVNLSSRDSPLPRFADFTNEVSATKYTLGLRYAPLEDLAFRASFGTGFLAPSINQIVPPNDLLTQSLTFADPKRGNVSGSFGPIRQRAGGGNPDLLPEESESWSAGVIFTPTFLRNVRLSVDYTRIKKTREIAGLSVQETLNYEDFISGRVTRLPLTAEDAALGYTGGVVTALDRTPINLAATLVEAFDVQLDAALDARRFGKFSFYAVVTWQPHFERQVAPIAPIVDSAGFSSGPLEWRGNAGVTWDHGPWAVGWHTQHYDSYSACTATALAAACAATALNQGSRTIPSQMYHDLNVRYRFNESHLARGLLIDTEISLGVENVFDTTPPILASTSDLGSYSTYGDPRLRRFTLAVRKQF